MEKKTEDDFGIWYSPGVAGPCSEIFQDTDKVYDYTSKWNLKVRQKISL